jgi:hypothetical protein
MQHFTQKAAKGYFKATLWLLDLQQVYDEINREKILALITVVLAVAPLLAAGWASPSNPSLA